MNIQQQMLFVFGICVWCCVGPDVPAKNEIRGRDPAIPEQRRAVRIGKEVEIDTRTLLILDHSSEQTLY